MWYNLGEVLWHGQIPPGWSEAEVAFERAVELDPGVAPYHHHLVDLAFSWHRDSALAARRIEAHPGREDRKRFFRLSLDLVFGSSEARREALERVETLPVPNDWVVWLNLRHPVDGEVEDRVLRILLGREDLGELAHAPYALVLNDLEHGRLDGGRSPRAGFGGRRLPGALEPGSPTRTAASSRPGWTPTNLSSPVCRRPGSGSPTSRAEGCSIRS